MTVDEDGLVKAKGVGTKHIYATASNGEVSVRGEYQIEVKPASITITKVTTTPTVGTKYKAGINFNGDTLRFGTGVMSGNFGATSTELDDAVDYELETAEGGYYLKVTLEGNSVKYANATASGQYFNLSYDATAKTVWTWNAAAATFYAAGSGFNEANNANNGINFYLGAYGTYNTLRFSKASFIEGETNAAKIDAAGGQYPLHFYTVA